MSSTTTAITVDQTTVLRALVDDFTRLDADINSAVSTATTLDLQTLRDACDRMRDDTSKASAHFDLMSMSSTTRGHAQKGLGDLQTFGRLCAEGVSAGSLEFLSTTLPILDDGLVELRLAKAAIGVAAPHIVATTSTTATPKMEHVGDTVLLPASQLKVDGSDSSVLSPPIHVTLVRIFDQAQGAGPYNDPAPGHRFVGVQLRIVFMSTYSGAPFADLLPEDVDADVKVYDSQRLSYSVNGGPLQSCTYFSPGLNITPGQSVLGCVTFQLPTSATIASVTFTPGLGKATSTAEWQVP